MLRKLEYLVSNVMSQHAREDPEDKLDSNSDRSSIGRKTLSKKSSFESTEDFETLPKIKINGVKNFDTKSIQSEKSQKSQNSRKSQKSQISRKSKNSEVLKKSERRETSICSTFLVMVIFSITFVGSGIFIMIAYHEVLRDEKEVPIMLKSSNKNSSEVLDHEFDCYAFKGDGFCDDQANNLGKYFH